MSGASRPWRQMTFADLELVTGSPELVAGPSRSDSPVGPMIAPSGPAPARASRTARRAKGSGTRIPATSGPTSSGSSARVGRRSSSASRSPAATLSELSLRLLSSPRFKGASTTGPTNSPIGSPSDTMASHLKNLLSGGSIVFVQTWRERVTPSGFRYSAHTARARTTSDSECSGWPTPTAIEQKESSEKKVARGAHAGLNLAVAAQMAPWPTARAGDSDSGSNANKATGKNLPTVVAWATPLGNTRESQPKLMYKKRKSGGQPNLAMMAESVPASPWATPAHRDYRTPNVKSYADRGGGAKGEQLPNQVQHSGPVPSPSYAGTGSTAGYRLNPLFSLWLMGYRTEWASCGARAMQLCRKSRQRSSRRSSNSKKGGES